MSDFRLIPLDDLVRRPDVRPLDEEAQAALADSIRDVGLANPITVRPIADGRYEIIAGSHRYAACDANGDHEIMCRVVDLDDLHAELTMIDENLCRAELSPSDRARQTARRKAIYEELHPETRDKVAGALGSNRVQGNATANLATASFAEATASATGTSERAVRRDAERGEKVIDEVLDMVRGTKLDTGMYLDRIKNLTPNDQVQAARRDLAIDRRQDPDVASKATSTRNVPKPKSIADEAYTRFITLSDDLGQLDAEAIVGGLPSTNQRADLRSRVRSLLAFLEAVDELMEGAGHA